jgi:hypothetical protein
MSGIPSFLALSTALSVGVLGSSAQAQTISRTFVSGTGTDNPTCSYSVPCRHLQNAYAATPANGEIDVLDPAGYGSLAISQPISLLGHGYTSMSSASSSGASITITISSGIVNIIGVELDGGGVGQYGISFTGGGTLHVQDSVIRNFTSSGITFSASNAAGSLFVSNTQLADNAGDGLTLSAGGSISGALDHITVENNSKNGIYIAVPGQFATANLSISDSVVAYNRGQFDCGISVGGAGTVNVSESVLASNYNGVCVSAANGTLSVDDSAIEGSEATGIYAAAGTVWVTQSTIAANSTGVLTTGGSAYSYGDNNLFANTTEGSFTSPTQTYK